MLEWFEQNLSTVIVIAVLVCIIAFVIYVMIKDKRQGKHSCGSSCCSCPMSDKCHSVNDNKK